MKFEHMEVAERLIGIFSGIPTATIVDVVVRCAEEFPSDDALFIEHAAKARLREHQQSLADLDAPSISPEHPGLRAEAKLTISSMIAANQSHDRLCSEEIDALLGCSDHVDHVVNGSGNS